MPGPRGRDEDPLERDDEELVAVLRAVAARVDPVPAAVLAAAREAFGGEP